MEIRSIKCPNCGKLINYDREALKNKKPMNPMVTQYVSCIYCYRAVNIREYDKELELAEKTTDAVLEEISNEASINREAIENAIYKSIGVEKL